MQNRYAGDVGDFGKLGLLRQISATGLKIGINWYLVPDESGTDDGRHIGYLNDSKFSGCDDALKNKLQQVVTNERCVRALEEMQLIKDAVYEHNVLGIPSKGFSRKEWHERALQTFATVDIVFLDPDNGLLPKSVSISSAKSIKFVTRSEIIDYYQQGKSVIFYNHRCREQEKVY